MAPKICTKGGFGHRDALDFVAQLRQAGMTVQEIREQLTASGYSKSRVSQLCPLAKPRNNDNTQIATADDCAPCPLCGAVFRNLHEVLRHDCISQLATSELELGL